MLSNRVIQLSGDDSAFSIHACSSSCVAACNLCCAFPSVSGVRGCLYLCCVYFSAGPNSGSIQYSKPVPLPLSCTPTRYSQARSFSLYIYISTSQYVSLLSPRALRRDLNLHLANFRSFYKHHTSRVECFSDVWLSMLYVQFLPAYKQAQRYQHSPAHQEQTIATKLRR